MMVVKQFSTQFEVKLSVKLRYSLLYMLRLDSLIFLVVKSYFHRFAKFAAKLVGWIAAGIKWFFRIFKQRRFKILCCKIFTKIMKILNSTQKRCALTCFLCT